MSSLIVLVCVTVVAVNHQKFTKTYRKLIQLSNNSANADIFQEAAKPYNNVLKNVGHKEELKYTNKVTIQNKRGKTLKDSAPQKLEPFTNNTKENYNKK